jgi:hypothetical protein
MTVQVDHILLLLLLERNLRLHRSGGHLRQGLAAVLALLSMCSKCRLVLPAGENVKATQEGSEGGLAGSSVRLAIALRCGVYVLQACTTRACLIGTLPLAWCAVTVANTSCQMFMSLPSNMQDALLLWRHTLVAGHCSTCEPNFPPMQLTSVSILVCSLPKAYIFGTQFAVQTRTLRLRKQLLSSSETRCTHLTPLGRP